MLTDKQKSYLLRANIFAIAYIFIYSLRYASYINNLFERLDVGVKFEGIKSNFFSMTINTDYGSDLIINFPLIMALFALCFDIVAYSIMLWINDRKKKKQLKQSVENIAEINDV